MPPPERSSGQCAIAYAGDDSSVGFARVIGDVTIDDEDNEDQVGHSPAACVLSCSDLVEQLAAAVEIGGAESLSSLGRSACVCRIWHAAFGSRLETLPARLVERAAILAKMRGDDFYEVARGGGNGQFG